MRAVCVPTPRGGAIRPGPYAALGVRGRRILQVTQSPGIGGASSAVIRRSRRGVRRWRSHTPAPRTHTIRDFNRAATTRWHPRRQPRRLVRIQYHIRAGRRRATGVTAAPERARRAPGAIYLVAEAKRQSAGTQAHVRRAQARGTIGDLSGTSGTVGASLNGTAALTCTDSAACPGAASEQTTWLRHGGHQREGPGGRRRPNADSVQSARRHGRTANDNAGDFALRRTDPRRRQCWAAGWRAPARAIPAPARRSHAIQDSSWLRRAQRRARSPTCRGSSPASATIGRPVPRVLESRIPSPDSSPRATSEGTYRRLHLVALGGGSASSGRSSPASRPADSNPLSSGDVRRDLTTRNLSVTESGT
jgi:hypothetical protein